MARYTVQTITTYQVRDSKEYNNIVKFDSEIDAQKVAAALNDAFEKGQKENAPGRASTGLVEK